MPSGALKCVVMFADVAGSTTIYEKLGDIKARERISRALNALISICKRHKGTLVKTIGDEILVYFTDIDLALRAAENIQATMEDDRSPETVGVSIRIGMHYGNVLFEDNDIYGDTVNVASRVVNMANARQILFSRDVESNIKSPELSGNTRQYDHIKVKGKEEPLDVFVYTWEEEGDITNLATSSNFTNPARSSQADVLSLRHGQNSVSLDLDSPVLNLGRDKECDLIVSGDLISRYHAKIEVRRSKFILLDQSTNGTFVRTQDGQNFFLRREDLTLFGSGVISLGKSIERAQENLIHYNCS